VKLKNAMNPNAEASSKGTYGPRRTHRKWAACTRPSGGACFAPAGHGGLPGTSKRRTSFAGALVLVAGILALGTLLPRAEAKGPAAKGKQLKVVRTIKTSGDVGQDITIKATASLDGGAITGKGSITGKVWTSTLEWKVEGLKGPLGLEGTYSQNAEDPAAIDFTFRAPVKVLHTCVKGPPPPPKDDGSWHVGATDSFDYSGIDFVSAYKGTLVKGRYVGKHTHGSASSKTVITTEITLVGGGATALAERLTVGGKVERGDVFTVAVGAAKISISAPKASPAAAASQIAKKWSKSGSAAATGISAVASDSDVWLTAKQPDQPFACTIDTTEADGEKSDGQTFSSSTQFFSGTAGGLWKKEIRHCGRLLATFYADDPSPTVGFFQWFECPVCGARVSAAGSWSKVK